MDETDGFESLYTDSDEENNETSLKDNSSGNTSFPLAAPKYEPVTEDESVDSEEDSSSSDSSDSERSSTPEETAAANGSGEHSPLTNPFTTPLDTEKSKESVFSIPIRESGEQEASILERHVKLTPSHKSQLLINGKKICWNYRKGKCRFGSKCTFAHDSDIAMNEKEGVDSSSTAGGSDDTEAPDPKRSKK